MESKPYLKKVAYICLYVSDMSESVKFYRDILGLVPANPQEDTTTSTFYAFKTGETILALERNGVKKNGLKTKAENPVLFQFKAESKEHLEKINTMLEEKAVKLIDKSKPTDYGYITNFCDPDGNKVEIVYQE